MKKETFLPIAVLSLVLAASLWNERAMVNCVERWQAQVESAASLARAQDWSGASRALEESYGDWTAHHAYLHIVARHDAADEADILYRRAMAQAEEKERGGFFSELAALSQQLFLLAEAERCTAANIF